LNNSIINNSYKKAFKYFWYLEALIVPKYPFKQVESNNYRFVNELISEAKYAIIK
jgi:hypothetical protein